MVLVWPEKRLFSCKGSGVQLVYNIANHLYTNYSNTSRAVRQMGEVDLMKFEAVSVDNGVG